MTLDTKELRKLAEAAQIGDHPDAFDAAFEFENAANPATVLALLDRIERLEKDGTAMLFEATMKAVAEQRDQLKAECEGLREDAKRYRWLRSIGGKVWKAPMPGVPSVNVLYDIAVDAVMGRESGK